LSVKIASTVTVVGFNIAMFYIVVYSINILKLKLIAKASTDY
jgi:hypothetical protein